MENGELRSVHNTPFPSFLPPHVFSLFQHVSCPGAAVFQVKPAPVWVLLGTQFLAESSPQAPNTCSTCSTQWNLCSGTWKTSSTTFSDHRNLFIGYSSSLFSLSFCPSVFVFLQYIFTTSHPYRPLLLKPCCCHWLTLHHVTGSERRFFILTHFLREELPKELAI